MGADDGKLMYRSWSTPEDPLYASSPTGNGEMVYTQEYEYHVDVLTQPFYNSPFFSNYDGTIALPGYTTSFLDGQALYSSGLSGIVLGNGYPRYLGVFPRPQSGIPLVEGVMRHGLVTWTNPGDPSETDQWYWFVKPFMFFNTYSGYYSSVTGEQFQATWLVHAIVIVEYDEEDWPKPGGGYYTPQEVANIISNWSFSQWTSNGTQIYKTTEGWNYCKKGFGWQVIMNQGTPTFDAANGVSNYDDANSERLTNQGTFQISIHQINQQ